MTTPPIPRIDEDASREAFEKMKAIIPLKCFICNTEASVVVYCTKGCTCAANKYQPRCEHHLARLLDTGEELDIEIVEDFRQASPLHHPATGG